MKILQEMECGGFTQAVKLQRGGGWAKYDGRRGGEAGCLSVPCVRAWTKTTRGEMLAYVIIIPVRFLGRAAAGSLKGNVLIASCFLLL